jgi:outer membrane immunogenic protein
MKRISVCTLALTSLLATSALAADLPVKAYTKAPPPVAVYDWTGFYVGGNVGYSWGRSSSTESFYDPTLGTVLSASSFKYNMDGAIGGGQIGYNWEWNRWVFGLEADIQASGQKGDDPFTCAGGTATTLTGALGLASLNGACTAGHSGDTAIGNIAAFPVTGDLSEKLDWFGTVRGRIGPTITPTVLLYATGGLAYGDVRTTETISGTNIVGPQGTNGGTTSTPFAASFGNSSTRVGWTVGAGVEGVISGNWTAKLEYLYMDLGSISGSFVTPIITPSGAFATLNYSSHITDNILRVGVNYKFSGPVVAHY